MKNGVYHQIENTATLEFYTDVIETPSETCETPHFHKNFEILAVIRGECRCEIGEMAYDIKEGEMLFVVPFQIHAFCPAPDSLVRRVCLHDHLIWSMSSTLEKKKPQTPVFSPAPHITRFFLVQMAEMFGNARFCTARLPAERRMTVKGCLYIIAGEFLQKAELIPCDRADTLMTEVVQYIANNYKNDISLRHIATEKGYSYHYLSRTFNRIFNISFKSMLNQYRMEHAHFLLQDTQLPIAEIAFESGFQSIRSLDHVCRQCYGRSPKEMRKAHYV
ncbi:MAG: helix-turn-helix transcriptional regulator [Clostridia bacterium]|nr:helix-turn-helix transcriptional regulator [Clostridia bacterium]